MTKTRSATRSATIPGHVDDYLDLLCESLGISKSNLIAVLIELGLTSFVRSLTERQKLAVMLKNNNTLDPDQIKGVARDDGL